MNRYIAGAGFALLLASGSLRATNIVVTTSLDQFGEDTTKCSLREAVQAANTDADFGGCTAGSSTDLITFQFTGTYKLSRAGRLESANATGDIDINDAGTIVIAGLGAGKTFIDGNGIDRVFDLACRADMNVQLIALTIRNGDAGEDAAGGGGIRDCAHALTLSAVHVTGNNANRGGGMTIPASAGAITISRSSFTRNQSFDADGSAIRHNGNDLLKLTNTTLSENIAKGNGALSSTGDVTMKNVTVAHNTAGTRAGVFMSAGTLQIDNSILADNAVRSTTSTGDDLYCATAANSDGYNIVENADCNLAVEASDLFVDPKLGTLSDAGGGLPVHVLLPGSQAINTGAPVPNDGSIGHCAANDQRSVARLQCDRGAFEYFVDYSVNSTADAPDDNPGNGICHSAIGGCTLRAALMEAATQDTPIVISIPAGVFNINIPGADEDLGATGDLDILALDDEGRTLMGAGPDKTIIRGNGSDRVFDTSNSSAKRASIGLFGMRIEGGDTVHAGDDSSAFNGGGARLRSSNSLTIDRVWFDRNTSGSSGGGLHILQGSGEGPARVTRSAFTRNTAVRDGGGASFGQGIDTSISDSLFADNLAAKNGGGLVVYLADSVELSWSTVTGNYAGNQGGGISLSGGEIMGSMLITGNANGSSIYAPDCSTLPSGSFSSGYNLIGAVGAGTCVFSGDTTGDQIGVAIGLSQVSVVDADMPYAAPSPGSIALGALARSSCERGFGQLEPTDQQSQPRLVDDHCTIGAIEAASDLIFADGIDDRYPGE